MRIGKTEIVLRLGDITEERVDAIVNAANSSLLGGGGVDGAIHRAGGPGILEECTRIRKEQGPCPAGHAVVTRAFNLRARHVIHTVGPIWRGGGHGEAAALRSCYGKSLALAAEKGARTISFPSISTGAYGYPIEEAAPVALGACASFARERSAFEEIRFVLFSEEDFEVYRRALEELEEQE